MNPIICHLRRTTRAGIGITLAFLFAMLDLPAATWSVTAINSLPLDAAGSGFTVGEMSGVTYLGPSPEKGKHRFLTVQDNGQGIVTLDVAFDLGGKLVSAKAIRSQTLSLNLDFEGIALAGSTVFLSDENGPGVRGFNPTTGSVLQTVSLPALFTTHNRVNQGLESLTYDALSSRLWTATESALTIDGPVATPTAGSTVRLLELNLSGNSVTAGSQFAYQVEPIHGGGSSAQNGLVELVSLPDGALLGLERSLASTLPPYLSRIYEIDFSTATDVSAAPYDAGLLGQTITKVGKELLWSGGAGGGFGQNLEGLTVGPRLPSGDWVLLGVVDNGDPLSGNTLVSLRAAPAAAIPFDADTGDFDQDGDVDGADFLAWQRGFGIATLTGLNDGDGNQSGTVTAADFAIWKNQLGISLPTDLQSVPEPTSFALFFFAVVVFASAGSGGYQ